MSIYIVTLTGTGILVTENTFTSSINKEIERSLKEQRNIHDSASLYLIYNQKNSEETLDIKDQSNRIVDMFSREKDFIEVYNSKAELLATSFNISLERNREDIDKARTEGLCYVLSEKDNIHYLFITDTIKVEGNELILSYIKNIEDIYLQKNEQYLIFLRVALIGLIFIAFISVFISRLIVKPIDILSQAARHIASGGFSERVVVSGKDEVSDLGNQFNKMATEIEKRINELRSEGERKQRFIDNLTHELRTPLTSVIGYSELLQKLSYDEAAFNKGLRYIHSEGQRMLKLISSLMGMIMFRENKLKVQKVSILKFLEEAIDLLKLRIEEKGIKIELKGDNFIANMDEDMIKEVIINLIDNSIKASKEDSKIVVGTEIIKGFYSIYVKDEGSGMEEEEIAKITEPFYRVDKSRARKAGGVGLGLSICKEIVEKHKGELLIESKLKEGTKVSVIFKEASKGEMEIA
jgi:signal transduction histidine kinase